LPESPYVEGLLLRLDECFTAYAEIGNVLTSNKPSRNVEYAGLAKQCSQILKGLRALRKDLAAVLPEIHPLLDEFESMLVDTMAMLHEIVDRLAGKADGRRASPRRKRSFENADPGPVDVGELARTIRFVAFTESRELAALWGRTYEDLGASELVTEYAYFIYVVLDRTAYAAHGDPWRRNIMTNLRSEVRGLLAGSSAAAISKRRFDAIFDDVGAVYAGCMSIFSPDGVVARAAMQFTRRVAADEPPEGRDVLAPAVAATLTQSVLVLLSTDLLRPFSPRRDA
jgi:hypothetical protein